MHYFMTKLIDILLVTIYLNTSFLPETKQCIIPTETWAAYIKVRCEVKWRVSVILGSVIYNYDNFYQRTQCLVLLQQNRRGLCLTVSLALVTGQLNGVNAGWRLSVSEMALPALERERKCNRGGWGRCYKQSALLCAEAYRYVNTEVVIPPKWPTSSSL